MYLVCVLCPVEDSVRLLANGVCQESWTIIKTNWNKGMNYVLCCNYSLMMIHSRIEFV